MIPAAEVAGPSLWIAALRLCLALAVICAGAWAWLYWQRRIKGPTRQLEVLDRAFLARGASVTLLRVGERRLLVGVSPDGVRLLRDLDLGPEGLPGGGFDGLLGDPEVPR